MVLEWFITWWTLYMCNKEVIYAYSYNKGGFSAVTWDKITCNKNKSCDKITYNENQKYIHTLKMLMCNIL